jgi:hypothetical protein
MRGNVDHLVVGDAGVFVVDSKAWWRGVTTIGPDGPVVTPRYDNQPAWTWDGLPRSLRGTAAGLSDGLRDRYGTRHWVEPVVVIWGDFPDQSMTRDRVHYVAGEFLAEWLNSRPARTDAHQLRELRRILE